MPAPASPQTPPPQMQAMPGMAMPAAPAPQPAEAAGAKPSPQMQTMPGMSMPPSDGAMAGKSADSMAGMDMSGAMMAGVTGSYSMMRDASGTAWQPDTAPMVGLSGAIGDWTTMLHGY